MLARQSTELLRLRSGAAAMAAAHASLRRLLFRTMPQAQPGQQGITRDTVVQLAAALSTQHDAVLRACGTSATLKPPPATAAAAQPLVTLALAAPDSDSDSDPQAITTPSQPEAPQPEATLVPKPSGSSGAAPKQKRPSVPTSPSTKAQPRIAAQTRTTVTASGLPVSAKKAAVSAGSGAAGTTSTGTGTRVKGVGHQSAPGYQIIAAITRSELGGQAGGHPGYGGAAGKATVEGGAGMQEHSTA